MSFTLGIRVYVKFRFLGFTLGTFDRAVSAAVSAAGTVGFTVLTGAPPSGVTTLFNENGVLLQVWA